MTSSESCARHAAALQAVRELIRGKVIRHFLFEDTMKRLRDWLDTDDLILLVGPSGVGKGVLISKFVEEMNEPVRDDPRLLNAVSVTAPRPRTSSSIWIPFWKEVLRAAHDPLRNAKVDREARRRQAWSGRPTPKDTEAALYGSVLSTIEGRGLKVIVVDEALALIRDQRGRTTIDQLDALRDLSAGTGCKIVLAATYRLLAPLNLSGELARRMVEVPFPRYTFQGENAEEEYEAFIRVAGGLIGQLPEEMRPTITSADLELLHFGSVGCVGLLAQWVMRAMKKCESDGAKKLQWSHFRARKFPKKKLDRLYEECRQGEKSFQELTAGWSRETPKGRKSEGAGSKDAPAAPSSGGKAKGPVGQPKPSRHRAGR